MSKELSLKQEIGEAIEVFLSCYNTIGRKYKPDILIDKLLAFVKRKEERAFKDGYYQGMADAQLERPVP